MIYTVSMTATHRTLVAARAVWERVLAQRPASGVFRDPLREALTTALAGGGTGPVTIQLTRADAETVMRLAGV